MAPHSQIIVGAPYDDLNVLISPPPKGVWRFLRVAFQIREDATAPLAVNCLDGRFEMLAVFHGLSPDREVFASHRFMSCQPWKGHLPAHISCVRKVRQSLPLVQWIKTHSFIGHSDGHPAQSSTTPLLVCFGRAMPFRSCCGKLCRHAIDAERRNQGTRGTDGRHAV